MRSLREPCGPRAAPSRGHHRLLLLPPRRLLPHPPHALRRTFIVTPGVAFSAGQVRPGCSPPAPVPRGDPGVSAGWLAGWPGGRRCACAEGAVHSGTCSFASRRPPFLCPKFASTVGCGGGRKRSRQSLCILAFYEGKCFSPLKIAKWNQEYNSK